MDTQMVICCESGRSTGGHVPGPQFTLREPGAERLVNQRLSGGEAGRASPKPTFSPGRPYPGHYSGSSVVPSQGGAVLQLHCTEGKGTLRGSAVAQRPLRGVAEQALIRAG